ncbi:ABC transporter permease [Scrofimicrobium sp. R131]|uniref:ABC transporter permease n=1 Tax=Scrofimicrobium appendicitidis TaxID=3079930 RepID=A0AAU7V5F3_9ACTO
MSELIVRDGSKPWTSRLTFTLSSAITGLLLVAVVVVNVAVQPTFFTLYSFTSNFATFVPLVFAALAQAIVVIGGGLDLSIGAQVALISVIALRVMDGQDSRIVLGLLAAILAGAICGAINGLVVAIVRLQPLIATFATASVFSGLALFVLPAPGGAVPPAMTSGYRMAVAFVPVPVIIVVLGGLLWWMVSKTKFVRHLYAVGGDREAAYASLVPVTSVIFSSFTVASVFTSFAAFAVLANTGSGDPLIGANMALDSIAAVVLGGIALSGGRGKPIGAIAGALILAISTNILAFMRVPTTYRALASGLIIIFALALSVLTTGKGGKK